MSESRRMRAQIELGISAFSPRFVAMTSRMRNLRMVTKSRKMVGQPEDERDRHKRQILGKLTPQPWSTLRSQGPRDKMKM